MRQDAIPFALAESLLAANLIVWVAYSKQPTLLVAPIVVAVMWLTWKLYQWAGQ